MESHRPPKGRPWSPLRGRPPRAAAAVGALALLALAAGSPLSHAASTPVATARIARGVTIMGVRMGGLTSDQATAKARAAFERPLQFRFRGRLWKATPEQVGARAYLDGASLRALAAAPGTPIPLVVTVDGARLRHYVDYLDKTFSRPARAADASLVNGRAVVVQAQPGVAVEKIAMAASIVHALNTGSRAPLPLAARGVQPPATKLGRFIVIRLQQETLTAYDQGKPVLTTLITAGRPALRTPSGVYGIQYRASPYVFHSPWPKGNPFWYPPTPVNWVMFFYDGDFIHDDPGEPASAFGPGSQNGPYASHGCVHVQYAPMKFLYTWTPPGAKVIVADS